MKENPRAEWDDPIARAVEQMSDQDVALELIGAGVDSEKAFQKFKRELDFFATHGIYPSKETREIL